MTKESFNRLTDIWLTPIQTQHRLSLLPAASLC